ncbi:hypothetical protein Asppvi_005145 [Aspergillus pseudoviridinutans]|uniref:ERCC4 domain-containing protein n=1 Tax=Aspergillus pseudoviridinutans TaxID=1517512 RepID=A0A9P3ESJ6_9EURO|nr:uncharacterized protein Asppvi_005145 [Aspergillus pseudoviridinutans]GIJ86259.1 hypothetical protein Asppvi_005145 [Aspergillus pseudoviridinutans]
MPEVINLLSSTPPPPASQPRQPLVATLPSDPPLSSAPRHLLSDDIESLFAYDDIDKPAKRRRISEEVESPKELDTQFPTTNLFLFSDDDVALPSDGPSTLKIPAWNEDSDPIVFTSPAPVPGARPLTTHETNPTETNTITIDDDDDDDGDAHVDISNDAAPGKDHIEDFSDQLGMPDIEELVRQARTVKPSGHENTLFSSRTASLLAGLKERSEATSSAGSRTKSRTAAPSKKAQERDVLDLDDDLSEVVAESRKPARKTTKLTAAEKEARAKEREAAKAQREHEKQLEKERQKKLREEKAREKQLAADLAEVNKLKVDKKESTPEMILDLASSFRETSVGNQSIELMKRLGVEHTFFTSSIPNIVKWRRKVTARYNETAGHWEPCPHHIRDEDHVLCLVTAQDFVNMVIAPADPVTGTTELELHLDRIKKVYPRHKPIYLIEGLTAWMRKNQNSRNRAFQAQVRRQLDQNPDDPSSSTRRRKPPAKTAESTPPVDDDTIEDALLELQVTHACLIHHTSAAGESAEWIKNFTEHISTIPYKRERMDGNDSAFCMDTGQVKPGEDKADTFVKMLQEVNRVTASMAYGIAARYPTVVDLVRGMRRHGPTMLEDVKKSANKNGALTDSRIGPAASKRLYKVFMGLDPSSTDI